ncbi:MAG: hypothetical protein ACLU97_03295 [Dorea sp.]
MNNFPLYRPKCKQETKREQAEKASLVSSQFRKWTCGLNAKT